MARIANHRKTFVVVLLAIYAFIAMPVQLWHNHTAVSYKAKMVLQKGNPGEFCLHPDDTSGEFCSICAHHYSAYSGETSFIIPGIINEIYQPVDLYTFSIPEAAIPGSCNKGPPAGC